MAKDSTETERLCCLRYPVTLDIQSSSIAPALIESCPTRIFLASPQAREPQLRGVYESFGLNARQIDLIARAQPRRDYYYQSPRGHRVFELGLGPVALAFVGASSPDDQRAMDRLSRTPFSLEDQVTGKNAPAASFAYRWLEHRGLAWAADLLTRYPGQTPHAA